MESNKNRFNKKKNKTINILIKLPTIYLKIIHIYISLCFMTFLERRINTYNM